MTLSNPIGLGAILSALVFFQTGCYVQFKSNAIDGSGNVQTEMRELEEFSAIQLRGVGTIEVVIGESSDAEVTFDDNLLELVQTEVVDGELSITTSMNFNSRNPLRIKITTPDLERLHLSGAGSIKLSGIDSGRLEIKVSGVGNLEASGFVNELDVSLSGTGKAVLQDLIADSVVVKVSGVGSARVHALESVDAVVSGVGGVTIYGNPKDVKRKASGIGKITLAK